MHLRTTVIDLFSTFIQFSGDRFDRWISDWRLQKEIEKQLARGDNASQPEEFWALYWYQCWQRQSQPQAANHLNAYLQEPCYWAIHSIIQRFTPVQWTVADGFQTAIAQTDRILKSYRPDYGSDLRAYAHTAFSNLMRDQLRQQQQVNICSDWGLLRRLSQTQLKQSLLAAGFSQTEPPILVWQCFKAVYTPDPNRSVRALPPPSAEQFVHMTERYNHLRLQRSPNLPQLEAEALVTLLNQSVQAARAYLAPAVTSLNQPQFDSDRKTPLDDLSNHETPMEQMLAAEVYAEQQQRIQHIEQLLKRAIATFSPADQTLLRLYYQETLNQVAIADQMQIKQYQVSRQLGRVRQRLLLAVAQWSQETLHISINSTVLASMSNVIHEWLHQHYSVNSNSRVVNSRGSQ